MDSPDRLPHLARLAEAHEPDLIRAEIEAKVAEWAKPKRPFHHSKIAGAIFGGVIGIAFGIFLLLLKTFWGK